jgi:hypothetical protein
MVTNERAEQILKIFQCEPGDIVKFITAHRLTSQDLQYLLNHFEGSEEIKNRIRQELTRRQATQTPGRMPELIRYFQQNREQFGDPEINALNRALDLTWNPDHKLALRWSWQDTLGIDLLPENESLIFCALIWEYEFHLDLKDSHRFLYVNAALRDFETKIKGPYPYTNKILTCRTPEGESLKAAFEAGLDYLEKLG